MAGVSHDMLGRKASMDRNTGQWQYEYTRWANDCGGAAPKRLPAGTATTMPYDLPGRRTKRVSRLHRHLEASGD